MRPSVYLSSSVAGVGLVQRHGRRVRPTEAHEGFGMAGVDEQVDVGGRQVAQDLIVELLLGQLAVGQRQGSAPILGR